MSDQPRYRFWFRRAVKDPQGYYMTSWEQSVPVQVVAANQAEAYQKLWDLSGEPPRHRVWTAVVDRVSEEPA